jgi:hypothetical protein
MVTVSKTSWTPAPVRSAALSLLAMFLVARTTADVLMNRPGRGLAAEGDRPETDVPVGSAGIPA